jgi:hypothetical protein
MPKINRIAQKVVGAEEIPGYFDVGRNIRYCKRGNTLIIRIDLDVKNAPLSQTGASRIIAATKKFESLSEGCEEDIGLILTLTKRVKKAKAKVVEEDD